MMSFCDLTQSLDWFLSELSPSALFLEFFKALAYGWHITSELKQMTFTMIVVP